MPTPIRSLEAVRLILVAIVLTPSVAMPLRAADAEEADPSRGDATPADAAPDPLADTPRIDPSTTGADAERTLATMLPPRSDAPPDWAAPLEPLHDCGEPRALPPCVPPPPCHPAAC